MWSSQAPSASSPPAPTLLIVPPIAHLHRLPTTYLPCRPRLRLSSRLRGPPPRLPGLRSIEVGTKPPSLPPIAPWYWLHPHLTGSSISVPPTTPPPSQACYLAPTHLIPPPPPTSIVVGNGSTLPVTSVGASVLPGPFYLNDVLVAPHITHNLLFVRRFTDNSCFIEFDPSGFSVKDLATRPHSLNVIALRPLHALTFFHQRVSTSRPGLHHHLHHLASLSRPLRT
jgi:hypothetical protein